MNRKPRLFSLVNPRNSLDVFAVGIDMGDEAVVYRPEYQFGKHASPYSALRVYRTITDLRLVWDEEVEEEEEIPRNP